MTARQDLRNAYPFHNPRQHVACCHRPTPAQRPHWLVALLTRLFR